MITKYADDCFEVECDGKECNRHFMVDGDFDDVRLEIKEAGWEKTKRGDEWIHLCTECR